MLLGIKKSYQSELNAEQLMGVVDELGRQETDFWILKARDYQVENSANSFTLRKSRGTRNSPITPLIRGRLRGGSPVQLDVEIRPHWSGLLVLAFMVVVAGSLLLNVWTADKMTVNGVYRAIEPGERLLMTLLPLGVSAFLGYFQVVRPITTAEKWLTRELRLQKME